MSVAVWRPLYFVTLGGSISQSRFICQVLCSGMQVITALVPRGWSSEEGLSAKFGVAVFKASILNYPGSPLAEVSFSAKFGVAVFQTSILNYWGIHLPKYVHLPSFVYWFSRQISPVRVEISYCHLGDVSGGFVWCFGGLHLTCLYNTNWLFTTLIIQK